MQAGGFLPLGRLPRSVAQEAVYALVSLVPPGKVTTYSDIAELLGLNPRIVASILASNERLIVVPCHRVVGKDGKLKGYALGGPRFKRRLLEIEGVKFDGDRVSKECMIDLRVLLGLVK